MRLDCSRIYYMQVAYDQAHGFAARLYEFKSQLYHLPSGRVWASISSVAKGPHSYYCGEV